MKRRSDRIDDDEPWFTRQYVGRNTLTRMVSSMCSCISNVQLKMATATATACDLLQKARQFLRTKVEFAISSL